MLWFNYQTDASCTRAVLSGIKDCLAELAMNQWLIKMFAKSVSDIEAMLMRVTLGVSSLAECQKHKYAPEMRENSLLYHRTARSS